MDLLLLEDVQKLGSSGEVVKVSGGFARNFLLPRHLAIPATDAAVKRAKILAQDRQAQQMKDLETAQALKERLESLECNIPVKTGKEDKLYGSITHLDIAQALQKLGVQIDRRKIHVEPIKALGNFTASVKIHPQVEASLKVCVTRQ